MKLTDEVKVEHIQYRNDLKAKAKKLRNNMTKEELHLWYDFLKEYGVHFYRQKPIGSYGVFDLIRHAGRATFPRGEGG